MSARTERRKKTARVLLAGLPPELAPWLVERLAEATVPTAATGDDLVAQFRAGGASVIVVDHSLEDPGPLDALGALRQERGIDAVPILYCVEQGVRKRLIKSLVEDYGVNQILHHPLDKDELGRQIAALAGIRYDSAGQVDTRQSRAADAIAIIWEKSKPKVLAQVEVIEDAVASLLEGGLDDDLRRRAQAEAHKLAGSVGTFGFTNGSALAREMELIFQDAGGIYDTRIFRLSELIVELRGDLERELVAPVHDFDEDEHQAEASGEVKDGPLLLVASPDANLSSRVVAEAASRGMRTVTANDVYSAREAAALEQPDVALLDLDLKGRTSAELRLLEQLAAMEPPVPSMVFTSSDVFVDRVEVARRSGRGFLDRSLAPGAVLDAVSQLLVRTDTSEFRVLAVDDDPSILEMITALLAPLNVETVDDPLRFWEVLEDSSPDLLILDVEMPHVSGVELCRVVRNDPRWAGLPILFLTGHQDPDMIMRVFAAGADDFMTKPIVGPELLTRVENRLERLSLYRSLAETDLLTGVANRKRSSEVINGYLRLAERYGQPMCLAVLDLDDFKSVNDRFGHGAGDRVLRKLGDVMQKTFRGEDVVARWAGEEFVLGMYGMLRDDGVQRMAELLEAVRPLEFRTSTEKTFRVTFSAGVAQYPEDGTEIHSLYQAADEALRIAKDAGKNRVLPAGWNPDTGSMVERCDIVLIEDDVALAELLIHALETRGYRSHWIKDGAEAVSVLGGERPHLRARVVLLDVNLPGLDGLGVLRKLTLDEGLRGTRVIMLTVRANEIEVLKALELGAFDHVAKPFSVPVLMQRVRRALGK